ncbi:MAG TPA: EAL domain-containing protein [Candidatus Binatia bacterium]|jgi:diguanylate cyclase (GGDEF)-like protein
MSRNEQAVSISESTISERPALSTVAQSSEQRSQADSYAALRSAAVMMVDDEPTTMEVLQAFLENEGYQHFITTTDSTRAMELIASENPDIVLLDLNMPKVSGFDILRQIRAHSRFRHIPAIVLTSSDDSKTKLSALQLGASDFLAKPVDPSELALRLRNTLAAKAYQDRLTYYDTLTGLANRQMFMERVIWSIRCAGRDHTRAAVLHIGLDHFKKINDTLGHAAGDQLLSHVAQRLAACLSAGAGGPNKGSEAEPLVARVGGDEFNILLPELERPEDAATFASKVLAAMREPFQIEGREFFMTLSVGMAIFPEDAENGHTLLKNAGVALNQAKREGRNDYQFYSPGMNAKAIERLSMTNHLRRALEREELVPMYQPKVDIRTGRIIGAELLLRWYHPELGSVSPAEFIPLAEESGLIVPFGEWVLRAACKQNRTWQSAGLASIRIAVNVSARQFRDHGFLRSVAEVLDETGLDPRNLMLEITENVIMEAARENLEVLDQIKAMGIKLSIDDFGTGYSSLSYLNQLPLDELKIDRSFIKEIRSEFDEAPIVTAIVAMAHSLGLSVVVEGVETEAQLALVTRQGCDHYQGYLFSKPVTTEEFTGMLSQIAGDRDALALANTRAL